MSDETSLLPAGRGELATVTGANPLVARGMSVLTQSRLAKVESNSLKEAIFHYTRGMSQFEKGNFENAVANFNDAIRCNSSYAVAYTHRGIARLQAWVSEGDDENADRDFDEAIRLCNEAILRDPSDAMAHLHLGQAWSGKRDRCLFFRGHQDP